jgi:hypothetical protein
MVTYQVQLRRAFREHYAPEEQLQGDAVPATVEAMLEAWLREDPARRNYPVEPPKFALPKRKEDFQSAYDDYTVRLEQYDTYLAALQSFRDRMEVKAAEGGHAPPQRYPDEHRRLQAEDACRQLAGGGMAEWIHLDGPMDLFNPRDTETPSLTKQGWRAVFRVCVPPEYEHVFRDRTFSSVKGWTDLLEGYLRLNEKKHAAPIAGTPKPLKSATPSSRAAPRAPHMGTANQLAKDPYLGVHRHFVDRTDWREYSRIKSVPDRLRWLQTHVETRDMHPEAKAAAKERYRKRLAELTSPAESRNTPKKPSQSSFAPNRNRPTRSKERRDYSWGAQRAAHEGIHGVDVGDGPAEKRPATPPPVATGDESEQDPLFEEMDPDDLDLIRHREYTPDPSDDD